MGDLVSTVTQPTGRSFFSFLRRDSDELYWNDTDSEFQVVNLSTADEATRAPFRQPYVEDGGSGVYTWTEDVTAFLDDSYTHTSHELIGVTEYSAFLTTTVTISNGVVTGFELNAKITTAAAKVLFSFIRRETDGLYYNDVNDAFELFDVATAVEATRAEFRRSFAEDPAGTYKWTEDVSAWNDGFYTVITRELAGVVEILAGADYSVLINSGKVSEGVSLGEVGLNEDTGSVDNLKYQEADSTAIPDATIRVYKKTDWDAGNVNIVQGVSATDTEGRWQKAVFVPLGQTYTVVFSKVAAFGPDTKEITV
jgi:hypothetical protein